MDNKAKYLEFFEDQRKPFLDSLMRMVEYESPSLNPDLQKEVLAFITDHLEDLNYKVTHHKGKTSGGLIVATPDYRIDTDSKQLLIGHCDTVWPEGTIKEMPAVIENNRFSGPGIYDMKAGLNMIIFALKALHTLKIKPTVAPVVIVNTDEEIGSDDSKALIENESIDANRALILEPALEPGAMLKTARKGTGHFEITVKGKAAHAGLEPEKGVSAILELSHIIQDLFKLNDAQKGITVNVGTIDGGIRSNIVAPESKAKVDVRVMSIADGLHVEEQILNLKPTIPGVELEITGGIDRPPMKFNERNQHLWNIAFNIGNEMGLSLTNGISGGGSDGNFTSQYCATLDGLGAVGDGAHAIHEHIKVKETLQRAALLTALIESPEI